MKKRFLVIILCLFVDNFQASLGNNISQKLGRLFLNVKQPVLEHKYKIGLGIGVLAIAGAVWWYKGPPKGPFFNPLSRLRDTMMRREIVNTQELIDQSQIESQKRKKEFKEAQKVIEEHLQKIIEQKRTQESHASNAPQVSEQIIPQTPQPDEQLLKESTDDQTREQQKEEKVSEPTAKPVSEEKIAQTRLNLQMHKQLEEFRALLDEYDQARNKASLRNNLKEKFDLLSKQAFSKPEDIKKFKALKSRYENTIKQ